MKRHKSKARRFPLHPFKTWRKSRRLTRGEVVQLLAERGVMTNERYVQHVENCYRRPGYPRAVVLSEITGRVITAAEFYSFGPHLAI